MSSDMDAKAGYGLLAEFSSPEVLTEAIHRARAAGYADLDAFSPFPLEEAAAAMDAKDRIVAAFALLGGILGGLGGYAMQYFAMVRDYPLNVGGRPYHSWPSFIPITFELTVLGASLTGLAVMLIANGLPRPHHPLFAAPRFSLASDDRFFLCILRKDPAFREGETRAFLLSLGPTEVTEVA
jgi:hypothetical protein